HSQLQASAMVMAIAAALQETAGAVPQAAELEPVLLGWIILLPLIGFLINGFAAIVAARRRTVRLPADAHHGGPDEHEQPAEDHEGHAATEDEGVGSWTHWIPSFVAPGVVALAFVIALLNYFGVSGTELEEPI